MIDFDDMSLLWIFEMSLKEGAISTDGQLQMCLPLSLVRQCLIYPAPGDVANNLSEWRVFLLKYGLGLLSCQNMKEHDRPKLRGRMNCFK